MKFADNTIHWADNIAHEVKKRVEADPMLKKIVQKQGYLIYDEKTPSGMIHVGSGRGWIIHDAIAKAMRKIGLNARFVLSSDDIDPYDKPNKDLDPSWDKYLGVPFRNIPSPVDGYESFSDYYFYQCVEKFEELGIEAEIESTGEQYEKGVFNKSIKIALDRAQDIQEIYARLYKDAPAAKKLPFNVICENCGKIATTIATHWDKKKELVAYECSSKVVKWANGCGHIGKISPYDGNGKFPWKVEWPAKWFAKGVLCELAGKDHFTRGGSRTIGIHISTEIFGYPPPYPSTSTDTGRGYEFFNIGGRKMSTSKGRGCAFADITTIIPPRMVRFLLVRSRPNAVIDFDPHKDNDIIFLFDRYDKTERIYFGKEKLENEKELEKHKRIYELSQVGEAPKKIPLQIPLTFAAQVIQIGLDEEGALKILKKMGHLPEDLSGADLHYVLERLHDAKRWVDNFASDNYKFELQERVNVKVGNGERKVLHDIAKLLKKKKYKKYKEEDLHNEFYEICKKHSVEPKQFFKAAYGVLINKERGPKLAAFVLAVGEKAVKLFEAA